MGDYIIPASPPTQRCTRCGAEWWDAHVCPRTFNTTTQPLAPNVSPPNEIDTLRASIAELESALAKSTSREAELVEKLKVAEEALLSGARSAEALKRPCGMDPETPQAIRNGEYMSISLNLRAALAKIKEAS